MGGDSFQGTQKLTTHQYKILTSQILQKLVPLCHRIQPYIPLPEKTIHGDIDFLLILKPQYTGMDIINTLQIQRYIINNNKTMNTVYANKQVDFSIKQGEIQFQIARFYKSYSGFGAYLGLFFDSKVVKLTDEGLWMLGYKKHLKFEFLLTRDVAEILAFYGLEYQRYAKGFQSRKELFEYMRKCRFLNERVMVEHQSKHQSKITKFFIQYLKSQPNISQTPSQCYQNPQSQTLAYFHKSGQFQQGFQRMIDQFQSKQNLNKKFNATHIMQYFEVQSKQVNKVKQIFRNKLSEEQQYQKFIFQHSLEEILNKFALVTGLVKKEEVESHENVGCLNNQNVTEGRRKKRRKQRKQQNLNKQKTNWQQQSCSSENSKKLKIGFQKQQENKQKFEIDNEKNKKNKEIINNNQVKNQQAIVGI